MDIIWCDDGLEFEANQLVGVYVTVEYDVWLITDTIPFAVTDTMTTHTTNSLSGGANILIPSGDWSISASGGLAHAISPVLTWDFDPYGGGVTITGFQVSKYDVANNLNHLVFGGMFDTPYAVPSGGGSLDLTIIIDSKECEESMLLRMAGRRRLRSRTASVNVEGRTPGTKVIYTK